MWLRHQGCFKHKNWVLNVCLDSRSNSGGHFCAHHHLSTGKPVFVRLFDNGACLPWLFWDLGEPYLELPHFPEGAHFRDFVVLAGGFKGQADCLGLIKCKPEVYWLSKPIWSSEHPVNFDINFSLWPPEDWTDSSVMTNLSYSSLSRSRGHFVHYP